MLKIRAEQMAVLSEVISERFDHELLESLKQEHPDTLTQMGHDEFTKRVYNLFSMCADEGIDRFDDIKFLIKLELNQEGYYHSPDSEWLREILKDESLDNDVRMQLIRFDLEVPKTKLANGNGDFKP